MASRLLLLQPAASMSSGADNCIRYQTVYAMGFVAASERKQTKPERNPPALFGKRSNLSD